MARGSIIKRWRPGQPGRSAQLTNTIIAFVAAATLWPAILSAADAQSEVKWKQDIAACVQEVRGLHSGVDVIDAFAKPGLRAEIFGTDQGRFQFRKCMAEKGWPLGEVKDK